MGHVTTSWATSGITLRVDWLSASPSSLSLAVYITRRLFFSLYNVFFLGNFFFLHLLATPPYISLFDSFQHSYSWVMIYWKVILVLELLLTMRLKCVLISINAVLNVNRCYIGKSSKVSKHDARCLWRETSDDTECKTRWDKIKRWVFITACWFIFTLMLFSLGVLRF